MYRDSVSAADFRSSLSGDVLKTPSENPVKSKSGAGASSQDPKDTQMANSGFTQSSGMLPSDKAHPYKLSMSQDLDELEKAEATPRSSLCMDPLSPRQPPAGRVSGRRPLSIISNSSFNSDVSPPSRSPDLYSPNRHRRHRSAIGASVDYKNHSSLYNGYYQNLYAYSNPFQSPHTPYQGLNITNSGLPGTNHGQHSGQHNGPHNGPYNGPPGAHSGPYNGPSNGSSNGPPNGAHNGSHNGPYNVPLNGHSNGPHPGTLNGPHNGLNSGGQSSYLGNNQYRSYSGSSTHSQGFPLMDPLVTTPLTGFGGFSQYPMAFTSPVSPPLSSSEIPAALSLAAAAAATSIGIQDIFVALAYKERQVLEARQNWEAAKVDLENFRRQLDSMLAPEIDPLVLPVRPTIISRRCTPNVGIHSLQFSPASHSTPRIQGPQVALWRIDSSVPTPSQPADLDEMAEQLITQLPSEETSKRHNGLTLTIVKCLLGIVHCVISTLPIYQRDIVHQERRAIVWTPEYPLPMDTLFGHIE